MTGDHKFRPLTPHEMHDGHDADDEEPAKKPSDRIAQLAKEIKNSNSSTKYKHRPEMPQYVQAIVKYLDELHADLIGAEIFVQKIQAAIDIQTKTIEEVQDIVEKNMNEMLEKQFPGRGLKFKLVPIDPSKTMTRIGERTLTSIFHHGTGEGIVVNEEGDLVSIIVQDFNLSVDFDLSIGSGEPL